MAYTRRFTAQVKRSALNRSKVDGVPRCECHRVPNFPHCCGGAPLTAGNIIYEHVNPWEFSRDSSLSNCACLSRTCADLKTTLHDIPAIAQSNRRRDAHWGTKSPPRHPLPCGRKSRLKKPIGLYARPVPRVSQTAKTRAYLATLPPKVRGQMSDDGGRT